MQNMERMGRFGDTRMAHVSPGEMVVPKEILDKRPNLQRGIMGAIAQEGMDPRRYRVGTPQNSINPMTGQPEYFNLKKLLKFAAPFVLGPAIGSMLGSFGGATAMGGALRGALGAAGTSALTGGKKKDILRNALLGGVGGYSMSKGQPLQKVADAASRPIQSNGSITPLSDKFKAETILGQGIQAVAPESFLESPIFNAIDNPLGMALSLGITAEAFAAMGPQEKEKVVDEYNARSKFGTTDRFNPLIDFTNRSKVASRFNKGGVAPFPRRDGGIMPSEGTGTKDDVPAMLTAGEFVLTRDAVKGLGNGNLNSGIQKAYGMMDRLERRA